MIEAQGLSKAFGEHPAVDDLTFGFRKGRSAPGAVAAAALAAAGFWLFERNLRKFRREEILTRWK